VDWLAIIIGALLAGLIIGPLARLVMPGRQDIGILGTIVAGAIGALVGGIIAQLLGVGETEGIDWIKHLLQVVAAVIAIAIWIAVKRNSGSSTGTRTRTY
jgi:uncharacterized membrane protein YeaQ/YmgE (transglycosylase-associated protein family)